MRAAFVYLIVLVGVTGTPGLASGFHPAPKAERPSLSCSAEPAEVVAGEQVTLSTRGMDLPGSKRVSYRWSVSGGTATGDGPLLDVDTKGLMPGTYTANAWLVDGKRLQIVAGCTTTFRVAMPDPPSVRSCLANRAAINSGDPVSITMVASGGAGTTLRYSYSSTNGQVAGDGTSALLSTQGATPGGITVTCLVTDDFGRTASATASVVVATPVAPTPSAIVQQLCVISFERDRRRPDRVDNEGKGCLDGVALDLNRDTGASVVMLGRHDGHEGARIASARALNAKEYLTQEKGIDGGRVRVRVSDHPGRLVEATLIPAGATPEWESSKGVDDGRIQRSGEAYGRVGKRVGTRRYWRRRRGR